MGKMKTYFLYIIGLILFAIFSEFLIAVGLNSTYKQMESSGNIPPQVNIYQSEATTVNGRIKGIIKNEKNKPIEEKYLKLDFYSERDVNMGSSYIEIDKTKEEMPFESFFKLNNVAYYKAEFVNEKDSNGEIEFIPKDLDKKEIVVATVLSMLIFW